MTLGRICSISRSIISADVNENEQTVQKSYTFLFLLPFYSFQRLKFLLFELFTSVFSELRRGCIAKVKRISNK